MPSMTPKGGRSIHLCLQCKCLLNSNYETTAKLGTETAQKWERTGGLANLRMEFQKEGSPQPET